MGNRTGLYVFCLVIFPLAFAAFVVGFGTPVWVGDDKTNNGLWQLCGNVFKDCNTFDFDQGSDWMIGVRAVEVFALVMLVLAAVDLVYENYSSRFGLRSMSERLNGGILCILGGSGGLAGVIVYVVETDPLGTGFDYGWSLFLVGSGAGVALLLGICFIVSAVFIEKKKNPYAKSGANGHSLPYLTNNDENYELAAYTNRAMRDDNGSTANLGGINPSRGDNLPGFAMYNGLVNRPGYRSSLPMDPSSTAHVLPPFPGGRGGLQPAQSHLKGPGYYSVSDERVLGPSFDLSEGFQPAHSRPPQRPPPGYNSRNDDQFYRASRREGPYSRGGGGDPFVRGGGDSYMRGGGGGDGGFEDPYSRSYREPQHPRAGYNDPYGFDRQMQRGGGGDDPYADRGQVPRDSLYRAGRF